MALAKHDFIDDYPYLVYTDVQTCVYSDKADTSIDDIGGGGGGDVPEGFYFIADENGTLNKTGNEIDSMYDNGAGWVIVPPTSEGNSPEYVSESGTHGAIYGVVLKSFTDPSAERVFTANSADDYPVLAG